MKSMGEPQKIDTKWLESFNLGGSQTTAMLGLLKWLGIIDAKTGASKGVWNQLRTNQAETLRGLVEQSYGPVFGAVDVGSSDRDAVNGAFIHSYQSGDTGRPITAFLALCSLSGIKTAVTTSKKVAEKAVPKKPSPPVTEKKVAAKSTGVKSQKTDPRSRRDKIITTQGQPGSAVSVTFNVEIPADWDGGRVRERIAEVLDALRSVEPSQ
jgi:hypothetical protein